MCCMTRLQKMQAQKTSDTEGQVETKALVDKLPHMLTSKRSEALLDTVVVTLA